MIELMLDFFSNYLIEFMGSLLTIALIFRWISYRSSKHDDLYYSTFTREIELNLSKDKENNSKITNTDHYLSELFSKASSRLPSRGLRTTSKEKEDKNGNKIVSLKDFINGKQGLVASLQSESSVFSSETQPNFFELTNRIMNQDKRWSKLYNLIPIDGVSRMIDILPGLFIVFGVFGTFIGISMALPEIAKIDFNNIEASGVILNRFVTSVTYAMKTSIAGIFFSITLTILNTMFPLRATRNRIFKKVENSVQQIWYYINTQKNEEANLSIVLPKMLETLENIDKHIQESSENKKAS